ncbi:MAG: hypothetical protein JXD21_01320 [Candidatus Omnitrophica bacterium]|nr:hypothetical protein [Candidatus Omnitrophota bacterium]
MSRAKEYIPDFDSTSSMLYSLSYYLKREAEAIGLPPKLPGFIGGILNSLPEKTRQRIYTWVGAMEGIDHHKIAQIEAEEMSRHAVSQYPVKQYPGMMIGSSNGAVVHLCAALDIPWLPQTFLVAIRRDMGPDDLKQDAEWGRPVAEEIHRHNPELIMHQMHDPVQDRLMVSKMGYFRMKRRTLGKTYEHFIKTNLIPGGTLFVCECTYQWEKTRFSDHHFFQVGGLGDVSDREYLQGSDRVGRFLKEQGSPLKKWDVPETTGRYPEAEWGFSPELHEDIIRYAKENGYKVMTIIFDHPEDISAFTADFYRWWYRKNDFVSRRVLIECFALLEPLWSVLTRSVPFWLAFNTSSSMETVKKYIKRHGDFDDIYVFLLSNGVRGIGISRPDQWEEIFNYARHQGIFLGVDEEEFPQDMGAFIRYHHEFKKKIKERYALLPSLSPKEFLEFYHTRQGHYPVRIEEVAV